jgi:beta-phosphoglucomutase-like phosphatase (HAD superfamily)
VAVIDAVIFDLDGVLVESEQLWDAARRELVTDAGGTWRAEATGVMQGMSSTEWSAYLHDALGVPMDPGRISNEVVAGLLAMCRARLPLLPGAVDAVERLGAPGSRARDPQLPAGPSARQRIAAVTVLIEREQRMSPVQRVPVIDAAARWLTEEAGDELARALLGAACSEATTANFAYLALIGQTESAAY